jgi:uncharacterized SAM-binding protein YcdF (DUF218 family)
MTDFIQLALYPQNLFLYGLLLAAICYRKKGLWLLFLLFYLLGNSFVANQVRNWQQQQLQPAQPLSQTTTLVVMGCGGSANVLPACARNRLDHVQTLLTASAQPAAIVITTRYCAPYTDYLLRQGVSGVIDCFDGGDNTYQEFYHLAERFTTEQPLLFVSSDYHGWRIKRLIEQHQLTAGFSAASTATFRPLNCPWHCWLTVNLSNYDFYAKLTTEWFSYASYRVTRSWLNWQGELRTD